jgi:anaphase-promoting complex subunit 4
MTIAVELEPNPILDLTALLVTGRPSEALSDFIGSAEQMSERVEH